MEWVVTTGKSVEEAKEAALDQLGVDAQEAEFEVLEEPRTGLFGRVRGEARVRARILPAQPRPKVERRDRRTKGPRTKNGAAGPSEGTPRPARGAKKAASRPPKGEGRAQDAGALDDGDDAAAPLAEAGTAPEAGGAGRTPAKRARGGRGANGGGRSRAGSTSANESGAAEGDARGARPARGGRDDRENDTVPTAPTEGNDMTGNDVTVAEQADLTTTFLTGLIDAFGLEGSIEREIIDEDTIEVKVVGDDLGLLIGPKGQTLVAVQELSRTYVQRKATGTHFGRVRIDVGGYRARRREALERFTHQVAEQVVASGIQKALEPMAASDRKVVHDTANGIEGVRTISEGEEPRRRVVIAPA